MIKTRIYTDKDPLEKVLKGTEKIYKAVSVTMGPKGQNVIFKKYGKRVGVTHDGVTVAKMVKIDDDEAENAAADILREAAIKMDATTGDGTTTVTVLAYHILKEAAEHIKVGYSPMVLKQELDALQPGIIKQIEAHTDKNVDEKKLAQVATVSAGDKVIGAEVAKVMFQAGADTPIMLGFSGSDTTRTEVVKGYKIDSGPASPYLMEGAGIKLEISEPKIIVIDTKLQQRDDVIPLLKAMASMPEEERRYLVVCSDIAGDALAYLVANHLKGFANIAVARVPQHIQSHSEYLADLAVSCGATVLSKNTSDSILSPNPGQFGEAEKVTVEPRETVIIGGRADEFEVEKLKAQLDSFKKTGKTEAARKFADDRLKMLEQKVVGIFVGGQTESEAEERHYRYEDAVGACRAAMRGGVVPGGGTLLFSIAADMLFAKSEAGEVLGRALRSPMFQVLDNAGIVPDELIIKPGQGIDVMHPEDGVIDLVERGILDPAESEIECVKTAIAIAGLLITSGAIIVDEGRPDVQTQQ